MRAAAVACVAFLALVACSDDGDTRTVAPTTTATIFDPERALAEHPADARSKVVYEAGRTIAVVAVDDRIVVLGLDGGVEELAALRPPPVFEPTTVRPIDAADVTGDGRADFLVPVLAASTIPGALVSDDGGGWRIVGDEYLARDAEIRDGYLRTHDNDCTPSCAEGTTTLVTWVYDRATRVMHRSDGDDTCADREQTLAADVDGDGAPDTVWQELIGSTSFTGVCTRGGVETRIEAGGEAGLLAIDVEPDGRSEILVGGTTVSQAILEPLVFVDGELRAIDVSLTDGPTGHDDAGNPATWEQWGCDDVDADGRRELVQVTATRTRRAASLRRQAYVLREDAVTPVADEMSELNHFPASDERLVPAC